VVPKSIRLIVVGDKNQIRSNSLEATISVTGCCIFSEPVSICDTDRNIVQVDESASKLLMGRSLTDGELGCALAHRQAIASAVQIVQNDTDISWALIVEDDADLSPELLQSIDLELTLFIPASPTTVSFYSPQRCESPVNRKNSNSGEDPQRSRVRDVGAVCYAINRTGLLTIQPFLSDPISFVADWPIYFLKLDFYNSQKNLVCELSTDSKIGPRPRLRPWIRSRLLFQQLFCAKKLASKYGIARHDVVSYLIVDPLIRDLRNRYFGWKTRTTLK
jgi:hypothetical protein